MEKRNEIERVKVVKAMELLARQINDEDIFEGWLTCGVADGDIKYGDLAVNENDLEDLEWYIDDKPFSELMGCFLRCMARARKSGGLYCNGITDDNDN